MQFCKRLALASNKNHKTCVFRYRLKNFYNSQVPLALGKKLKKKNYGTKNVPNLRMRTRVICGGYTPTYSKARKNLLARHILKKILIIAKCSFGIWYKLCHKAPLNKMFKNLESTEILIMDRYLMTSVQAEPVKCENPIKGI